MKKPASLVKCRLHGGPADAGERGDLIDWQIAYAMVLDLACDYAKDSALPFRVVVPERIGQDA
jgi:hypothetical protein